MGAWLKAAGLAIPLIAGGCVTLPQGSGMPTADDCAIVAAVLARPETVRFPGEITAFTHPGSQLVWDPPNPDPVDLRQCPGLEAAPASSQTWTLWPPRVDRTYRDEVRAFSRPVVIGDEASVELNHFGFGVIFQLRRAPDGGWAVVSSEDWSNEIMV